MSCRVLYIVSTLELTGSGRQLSNLIQRLPRDRFEVQVCALAADGPLAAELRDAEIPTTIIGRHLSVDPLAYWQLRRLIQRLQPEVVHCWSPASDIMVQMAAAAGGVAKRVTSFRTIDSRKSPLQWWFERRLLRPAERTVVNSASVRDHFVQHGLAHESINVIPDGVPPARLSNVTRAQLLDELRLPTDAWLVGVADALRPDYGIKELVWAADLIRVLDENMRLLIIGDGPQRCALERFARLASDLEHIRFLGSRPDLWRILPHLDLYWDGRRERGSAPLALIESMAAGVPVVASDTPGNRELIVSGESGVLVSPGDRAARARATRQLVLNGDFARRLGKAGQERVAERFGIDRLVERYTEVYDAILDRVAER